MPKKKAPPAGAPDWIVTFSDMMSLLLTFFILLVSMSEIKKDDQLEQILQSIREAFGGDPTLPGTIPMIKQSPDNSIVEQLKAIDLSSWKKRLGETVDEGPEGPKWRVSDVRKGVKVEIGGRISFDRFSAALLPDAQKLVRVTADTIKGHNFKITIRGHATSEPLPADSPFADPIDLSYARAKAVAKELVSLGIRPERITCVAAGDTEPVVRQAYDESRRSLNRRVEVIVTEDTILDYEGEPLNDAGLEDPE